jgi:hypothetical protein
LDYSLFHYVKTLNPVLVGWKALGEVLNNIVEGINRRTLIRGDGLTFSETANGVTISLEKKTDSDSTAPTAPAVPTGSSSGGAGGPGSGGAWLTVTVVDPNTCAQSTIQVWSKPGSG